MTTDNEPRSIVDNQPEPTDANPIARSVMARAGQGQRLLSPWVQRHFLASEQRPAPRQRQSALTLSGTASLLSRLQRSTDESRVWRPDVGSLNPLLVNNFTHSIVHRFSEVGPKNEPPTPAPGLVDDTDLLLAGAKTETATEPAA